MATRNPGPLRVEEWLIGGSRIYPPEFLNSIELKTTTQEVPLESTLTDPPTGLSGVVGSRITQPHTDELVYEETLADFTGIEIRDVETDPNTNIAVEVLRSLVAVGSEGNGGIDGSGYFVDIKGLTNKVAVKIRSKPLSSSLSGATKTYSTYIDYPFPDVLQGVTGHVGSGTTTTTLTGSFASVTWRTAWRFNSTVTLDMLHGARKGKAVIVDEYFTTAPGPSDLAAVQVFILASGSIATLGESYDISNSVSADPAGTIEQISTSVSYSSAGIPPCITNGYTGITESNPTTMPSSFIADCQVTPGRLNLYKMSTVTVETPS